VLSDPTKRLAYDSFVAGGDTPEGTDFSPPPHWDTGFEFSDGQADNAERSSFFEQLFGRAARSSRKQGHGKHFSNAMQGNDHHARSRCTS
jgi:curved DNA-binding protein